MGVFIFQVAFTMARRRRSKRAGPPHVALIIETSLEYGRGVLRGIARHVRENTPWSIFLEQRSLYDRLPTWLKDWQGDGIISRASSPGIAKSIANAAVPTIDLNEEVTGLGMPSIQNDHHRIGSLAATHFLERGFTHFGYIGYAEVAWSRKRGEGFMAELSAAEYACATYAGPGTTRPQRQQLSWEDEIDRVMNWIESLPKPCGVMACNDFRALQLIDACRRAGVPVPEQLAVIGVDNEEVACELSNPPLTSVLPDAERVGYHAAEWLTRLMAGDQLATNSFAVPPKGIVTRRSTDVTAINDESVASALHFIRTFACEGIGVDEVVDAADVSRSVLQRRFRDLLGRSIHDAILAARLDRVKSLLIETDLSLPQVAARTGFNHSEYLSKVFKQKIGQTITDYRHSVG